MSARADRPDMQRIIDEGAERAKQLNKVGMDVWLEKDGGHVVPTKTRSLPWQLGHGAWVVQVEGVAGGYNILRITPRPLKPL